MHLTHAHGHRVLLALTLVMAGAAQAQHVSGSDGTCRASGEPRAVMACFAAAVTAADHKLNETYAQIIKGLSGQDQASLRSAQRLWVQFRDATCKAEGDLYAKTRTASIAFEACVEQETQARSRDLLRIYEPHPDPASSTDKPAVAKAKP